MFTRRYFLGSTLLLVLLFATASNTHFLLGLFDWVGNLWNSLLNLFGIQTAPQPTVQQQFAQQLAQLQGNATSLASFYVANAGKYNVSTNQSWEAQVTDQNSTSSPVIGQATIMWQAGTNSFLITNGTSNTLISPTYGVSVNHQAFMAFSKDAVHRDVIGGALDYNTYKNTLTYKKLK